MVNFPVKERRKYIVLIVKIKNKKPCNQWRIYRCNIANYVLYEIGAKRKKNAKNGTIT